TAPLSYTTLFRSRRCIISLTGDFQQSVAAEKYHPRAVPWAEDSEDRQSEGVSIERLGLRKVFGSQQRSATENLHAKSPVRYNRGQPWCSKFWKPRDCHFRRRRAQHKCGTHRQ